MSKPDLRKGELFTPGRHLQQRMILSCSVDMRVFGIAEFNIIIEIIKWKIRQKRPKGEEKE